MGSPDICKVLVGNKSDLAGDRAIPVERAQKVYFHFASPIKFHSSFMQLAKNFDVPFFETSCKTDEHVSTAFEFLASMVKKKMDERVGNLLCI
jgi:GTPase SAR1 family protein